MNEKKKFLLRIDSNVYAALEKWAADDLRSINGQLEFLLTDLLKKTGRFNQKTSKVPPNDELNKNANPDI
jgi:hypothetical protein